jgi:hypothetical protein
LLAWIVLWWLLTRGPAKVACTAPTAHQLKDVLWAEIAKWHRCLPDYFKAQLTVTSDAVTLTDAPTMSFAVARTARPEAPEAFQGFHADHMLFLVDEASGVEDIIFETGEGAMSTPGAKTIMAGNPTRTSGYFFDAFHKMRDRWSRFKVGCADSSLVAADYAADMAKRYGSESNIYKVRVLGEFPESEDDVVIPLYLAEAAINREVELVKSMRPVWGLDVARFGDDRSALAKRQGNHLFEVKSWHGLDLMQTVGRVADEFLDTELDERPGEILVDVIGLGAGVVDRLRELNLPDVSIRGINVGEARSQDAKDRYMRLRDELWFRLRDWLDAGDCRLPDDDELIAELTGLKFTYTSSGKLQVEAKSDAKKRGIRSPDLADAAVLTFASRGVAADDYGYDQYARSYRRRIAEQRSGWRRYANSNVSDMF